MKVQFEDIKIKSPSIATAYTNRKKVSISWPLREDGSVATPTVQYGGVTDVKKVCEQYNISIYQHQNLDVDYNDLEMLIDSTKYDFMDLHEAKNNMQVYFDSLPVEIRRQHNYDVLKFIEYSSNIANLGKLEELGLLGENNLLELEVLLKQKAEIAATAAETLAREGKADSQET